MSEPFFLPELPKETILAAYAASPGDEVGSGKLASPESSAALAANAFGYFLYRPACLPPIPGHDHLDWNPMRVSLETELRFPFRGGRHPWLDVLVECPTTLIAIESKRYEPFRSRSQPQFSNAYFRDVWGEDMARYAWVRDGLHLGTLAFDALDAGQLVKHAFGLRTAVHRSGPHHGKHPVLLYLYAEPAHWSDNRIVSEGKKALHRSELHEFQQWVAGDEVTFQTLSYRELLDRWLAAPDPALRSHATALQSHFSV